MASTKQYKVKVGKTQLAAAGLAAFLGLLVLIVTVTFGIYALLGGIAMILFGILHAEVALGIPAFGYWACFWMTLALGFVASFFRSNSTK